MRVLRGHCEAIGRDAEEIDISTQAMLFLSEDESWLAARRDIAPGRSIVGTPSEVADIVQRYRDAGACELVIPDSMEPLASWKETCDLFMNQVVPQVVGR